MAAPSLTYTLTNGTTADASQVQQNFTDILNGITDGSKDLTVNQLTINAALAVGGNTTIGDSSTDTLTVNASLASSVVIGTNASYDIGSATLGLASVYIGSSGAFTTRLKSAASASHTITLPAVVPLAAGMQLTSSNGSGGSIWLPPSLSAVSKTNAASPYTILLSDGLILCDTSGGAITLSLPAATGSGRKIRAKKTTADLTAVTISRAGSDVIYDNLAASSTSATLHTIGEEVELCDTASATWHVISRKIPSVWTSYTPTGAWTTNTTYTGFWKRVGDSAQIQVKIALGGAPDAATLTVNNPTGMTTDTAKIVDTTAGNRQPVGTGSMQSSATTFKYFVYVAYASSTTVQPFYLDDTPSGLAGDIVNATTPVTWANSDVIDLIYAVPISGWNG